MKTVVQVVKKASVTVNGKIVSEIGEGLLLFVGFSPEDNSETMKKTIDKAMGLRIFADGNGKTNLPFDRDRQEVLCVSQFTLYADIRHGKRPSFTSCMRPETAEILYENTLDYLKESGYRVQSGVFGADMKVALVNDGPFTLIVDSEDLK